MTQAHKTPGALVKFTPDPLDPYDMACFSHYAGRVYEVISEVFPGHYSIKDIETDKILGATVDGVMIPAGFHPERLQTIPKQQAKVIRKAQQDIEAPVPQAGELALSPNVYATKPFVFKFRR